MPFCTACGHQNPDDARFCSQCGTRLVTRRAAQPAAGPARSPGRPDGDDDVPGAGRSPSRREERPLNDEDAAAVDALPSGQRAARRAARPERRQPVPARHRRGHRRAAPRQRDLPRRRDRVPPARRVPPWRRTGSRVARRRQPQRHLRQPRPDRRRRAAAAATRCRSASSGWCSSPATPTPRGDAADDRGVAVRTARMNIGEVHARLREDFPSLELSKLRYFEAMDLVEPHPDPGRLPQVLRPRRRAAALRPHACSATTTCR